jgi:dCTP diphosphatase
MVTVSDGEQPGSEGDGTLPWLQARLRQFARERDWEQFQTPKNLSMAIAVEAAELLEEFQWLTANESEAAQMSSEKLRAVSFEMADILLYLLRLADRLQVDLLKAVEEKFALNERRYPADKVRGSARKYSEYE